MIFRNQDFLYMSPGMRLLSMREARKLVAYGNSGVSWFVLHTTEGVNITLDPTDSQYPIPGYP